jgi:hypothetical protein
LVVGDEDEVILDCYRLAKHYSVSPDIFLSLPISELERHMVRTGQVSNRDRPPSEE